MKKNLIILCLVSTFSYSQQLYRQTFSSGFTTTQYGISMPGEAFNSTVTVSGITLAESLLYATAYQSTLSEEKILEQNNHIWYPNPTKGKLYIKTDRIENFSVVVFNVLGQQVLKSKGITDYIDLSNLPNGAYLLKLFRGEVYLNSKKIIKY
ncbi:MAG: T9SS type A sorting domain-containing protein [Xanthomarina gelatinilytica]|uniref:T9SS type A sorting domain-containing protein n=1 Tax=Xanthomarina gelatinilytica TaxID=1137281 RepID=UPI003A84CD25